MARRPGRLVGTTTLTPSQPRQVAPTALLVHIKGKQIVRFLATHEFLADARAPPKKRRCAPKSALTCAVGCDAFLAPWEFKPRT